MALIYGSHVTVKRQIIFLSVPDPLISARVSILLLTILKQTQYIGNLLKLRDASSISEKITISPHFAMLLLTIQKIVK